MSELTDDHPDAHPAAPPELPGYTAVRRIGAGAGSGEGSQVWLVRRDDGQRLAAKLVDQAVPATEQQLLQRLDHDHVLRLHDVVADTRSGRIALITDLAEGGSLAECLAARGRLTPGELVTVLSPVARALHDLHAMGVVHCDLSPSNILLTGAGKPLIADLGVSRVVGHDHDLWVTERWAAPEVLAQQEVGPAADVHALGAIAWAALAGTAPPAPHARPELAELAPHAPARLLDLVDDAMAFEPDARPSAGEFAVRLWDCAEPEPAPVAGLRAEAAGPGEPEPADLTRRVIREERVAREAAAARTQQEGRRARLAAMTEVVRHAAAPGLVGAGALALLAVLAWWVTAPSPSYAGVAALTPQSARTTTPKAATSATPAVPVQLVLSRALAARAVAWEAEDPARLDSALVPGSAAARSDTAALRTARDQQLDYRGVRFVVLHSSPARRTADRIVVTARVDRPGYRVVGPSATRQVAASRADVTFTLERDGDRWRISRWRAASTTPTT